MDIEAIKTLVTAVQLLWYVLVALLVAAAVALVLRASIRHGLVIAACSCSAVISLAWIVVVRLADSFILGTIIDLLGSWVLLFVPRVIEPTLWPSLTLLCSLGGIVFGVCALRRAKKREEPST